MDYTILEIIAVIVFAIGLVYLSVQSKRRGILDKDDVEKISNILGLSVLVLDDVKLKNEKELVKLSEIIKDSLDQVILLTDTKDLEMLKTNTYTYVIAQCRNLGLELTETRKIIIKHLIDLLIQEKFIK